MSVGSKMLLYLFVLALTVTDVSSKLSVCGTQMMYYGERVFLSGANEAWVQYAYDFGNNNYANVKSTFEATLQDIKTNGGNSIRVFLHLEGDSTPIFDGNGYVTGVDSTLISDMREFLCAASKHNILVFFTLWNGAINQNYHYRLNGLIVDNAKLQSYIDHALKPMVHALRGERGLGGWDIINAPEGLIKTGQQNANPCYDTVHLTGSGAGWAGQLYTAEQLLKFINWQVSAIKEADSDTVVTVCSWNMKASTDVMGYKNMYKDSCLTNAGGKSQGKLSFYLVHGHGWNNQYGSESPFKNAFSDFNLDKPLVIGEFNYQDGDGRTTAQLFDWAYTKGYAGAWTWSRTDNNWNAQLQGMQSLAGQTSHGTVNFQG